MTGSGTSPARSVLVVGTGLIGTSTGLALRERGHRVWLADVNASHLQQAEALGAGAAHRGEPVDIAVVAVPPKDTARVIVERLRDDSSATVTDTASIKREVQREVGRLLPEVAAAVRYVGGHPLAGRERGGPQRARAAMFAGRAWVLTPESDASPAAVEDACWLVTECGGTPVLMSAAAHDDALALTSHLPQLVASALAAQLASKPDEVLQLIGQGFRDMTRIAAADPELWSDIATGNAAPLAAAIEELTSSLQGVAAALQGNTVRGDSVRRLIDAGRAGHDRLPGKHGGSARSYRIVGALVSDRPGEMAHLLSDTAAAGVNVEDLRVEHAPGLPVGLIELFVGPESAATLRSALSARGWTLVDEETAP